MLDYAPDGLNGGIAVARGQEMSVVLDDGPADNGALLQLIAASKATASNAGRLEHGMFHPERMSGFCATS